VKKMLLLSALLALSAAGVSAKDWTEIRMASEGAYPPFNEIGANGALKGFDIDIGNALCEEMKAKCTWVKQEWDGMIPALVSRKFDAIIASMSITDERKAKVDFTDKYYASPLALIAKKGSTLRPDLPSLAGKKVGCAARHGIGQLRHQILGRQRQCKSSVTPSRTRPTSTCVAGRLDAAFSDYLGGLRRFPDQTRGRGLRRRSANSLFGKDADEKRAVIGEGIGIAVRKRDQGAHREAQPGARYRSAPTASTMRSRRSTSRWTSTATDHAGLRSSQRGPCGYPADASALPGPGVVCAFTFASIGAAMDALIEYSPSLLAGAWITLKVALMSVLLALAAPA
jgi:ABC-type amino acid transport substrate-binding protein